MSFFADTIILCHFGTNLNLVIEPGHHQLPYINLIRIFLSTSLWSEKWHYKLGNSDCIQRTINNFDWANIFQCWGQQKNIAFLWNSTKSYFQFHYLWNRNMWRLGPTLDGQLYQKAINDSFKSALWWIKFYK